MFDARPFFTALAELRREDEGIRAHLSVNFVGHQAREVRRRHRGARARRDACATSATSPTQTCLRYLAESDVLFLCQIPVHESASTKLSGKLFEYLYMRKPILALTLPGLTAEILARVGLGTVVAPRRRRPASSGRCATSTARGTGATGGRRRTRRTSPRSTATRQAERLAALADRVVAARAGR